MNTVNNKPTEAELLAPWYQTGSLSDEENAIIEAEIARNPDFARTLQLIDDERHTVATHGDALGHLSKSASDNFATMLNAEPDRISNGIFQRLKSVFSMSPRPMQLAVLSLCALAVFQTGFITSLSRNAEQQYQSATGENTSVVSEFTMLVSFASGANFGEITALLTATDGVIIAGPSAGIYTVGFASKQAVDDAMELFGAKADLVQFTGRGPTND